jgi:hypothetical protein
MLKHLVLLLVIISSISFAQSPQVNLNVTPNNLSVGTPFLYTINLQMDTAFDLIKIPLKEEFATNTSLNFITSKTNKTSSNNIRIINLHYELSSFELGDQFIPTQSIIVKNSITNKYSKFLLPQYPIYIASISALDNPENLTVKVSDALYFELNLDLKIIFFTITILVLLIISSFYTIKYFRKEKKAFLKTKKEIQKKDPFNEFITAINSNYKTISTLNIKDYYVKYSEIIKTYLSYILKTNTIELTSIEIYELTKEKINEQDFRRLKALLSFSDKVKFATYVPSENENKEFLEKAIETITKLHQNYNQQNSNTETSPHKNSKSKEPSS